MISPRRIEMSVYGEFHRYLETLIAQLEAHENVGDAALLDALRSARPTDSCDLSQSAQRARDALQNPEIRVSRESCEELLAICRIVVGG